MGAWGVALFLACAGVAIFMAGATIISKSPLRSALALLGNIVALAGIFLTLHAHLLAALQLIVYAGAIVVLFVFVIMLIGPSASAPKVDRQRLVRSVGAVLMGVLTLGIVAFVYAIDAGRVPIPGCLPRTAECGQFGGVEALGTALFTEAAVPFELVGVLLLVAIVGALAVARGRTPREAEASAALRSELQREDALTRAEEQRLAAEVSAHGGH